MTAIASKVSVKSVCGDVKKIAALMLTTNETKRDLCRFIGVANKCVAGESDKGPFVYFLGSFCATNFDTGEEVRSGKMFLPNAASDLLEAAVDAGNAVEFGFDISIVLDSTSATGYVYGVSSLIEPQENDPISMLKKSLPKAIAAPKKAAK